MEHQEHLVLFSGRTEGLFAEESVWNRSYSMQTRHFHSELELYFLIEGERYYFVDQNTYHLGPHTGILIGKNRIHKTSAWREKPEHRRFLLEYSRIPYESLLKSLGYPDFEQFGNTLSGPVEFEEEAWTKVMSFITDLEDMMRSGRERSSVVLKGMELLDYYAVYAGSRRKESEDRTQVEQSGERTERIHQIIDEIAQYLQQHYSENIRLDDLADQFYISRSRMTHMFKQITGFTVMEYLAFVRIREAEKKLRGTTASVTEISGETGFGNVTYFERVFRGTTGLSPLQYRKKHGRKKEEDRTAGRTNSAQ